VFSAGLVDEVQQLLETHEGLSRTSSQAVGYREVIEMLQNEISLQQTIERVTIRTRQFARRQETWFRSLSECRRVEQSENSDPAVIVDSIIAMEKSGTTDVSG